MKISTENSIFSSSPKPLGYVEVAIDIALVVLVTAFAFALTYHPYFFGDELMAYKLAIQNNYSFSSTFRILNAYKPRLVFDSLLSLLASYQITRVWHAVLTAGCMAWINILLYSIVRYSIKDGRILAWLIVATVLTSRYGTMLYFDYISGLIELLSTALLLTVLLFVWLAWQRCFNWWHAFAAFMLGNVCVFVHERYGAALLAIALVVVFFELRWNKRDRRLLVIGWAVALGLVPLLLFWLATAALSDWPITTGTAGRTVIVGWDATWSGLTYGYNVLLGGNFGPEGFWGHYNYLNPYGLWMGLGAVVLTTLLIIGLAFNRNTMIRNIENPCFFAVGAVVVALIAIASLTGLERQEARFMFPVGILVTALWMIAVRGVWRYAAVVLILATNMMYLLFSSYDNISNISASRASKVIAESLLGMQPPGRNGVVLGNSNDYWMMGGDEFDTFSRVNLKSVVNVKPFLQGRVLHPDSYDFGLSFNGFRANHIASYRLISASQVSIMTSNSSVDNLPVLISIGNDEKWFKWNWRRSPEKTGGAVTLEPSNEGWIAVDVSDLNGRWLVYQARVASNIRVPLRLQVNWHAKKGNQFLGATIEVVYPNKDWYPYSILLHAPVGADLGYVYANLHDGARDSAELKSVEIK